MPSLTPTVVHEPDAIVVIDNGSVVNRWPRETWANDPDAAFQALDALDFFLQPRTSARVHVLLDETAGEVALRDARGIIESWTRDAWASDPDLVFAMAKDVELGLVGGPDALRDKVGRFVCPFGHEYLREAGEASDDAHRRHIAGCDRRPAR